MSETVPTTNQTHDARSWQSELRTIQRWVEEHPVLLTSAAILLPSISIYHYTISEGVPLTIASPDIISALPSVLAAIAYLTVLLCALPIAPASLMFDGVRRGEDGRLRLLSRERGRLRQDLFRWLMAFAFPGMIIALGVLGTTTWWEGSEWPLFVVTVAASLSFTLIVRLVRHTALFSESTFMIFGMSTLQMLLAIFVMQLALRVFGQNWNSLAIFALLLVSMLALAFLQIFVVLIIEQTSHKLGFVMQAFVAALGLISFACILPPTGAALAGAVLKGSASGGVHCMQLQLTSDTQEFSDLVRVAGSRQTVPLELLSNADGVYLARKRSSPKETIYRIPTASVSALTRCPDDKN